MAKKSGPKSLAPSSGCPDFKKDKLGGDKTVSGPSTPVPTSGTPDFLPGKGQKTVKSGGGDASKATNAYSTESKAQKGPSSDF